MKHIKKYNDKINEEKQKDDNLFGPPLTKENIKEFEIIKSKSSLNKEIFLSC